MTPREFPFAGWQSLPTSPRTSDRTTSRTPGRMASRPVRERLPRFFRLASLLALFAVSALLSACLTPSRPSFLPPDGGGVSSSESESGGADRETSGDPCREAHTFGDWEIVSPPTCTSPGTRSRVCAVCGAVDVEELPATGHAFGDWDSTGPFDCSVASTRSHVCEVCGYTETETLPATGHAFGDWLDKVPVTCTEAGERERICTSCGYTETEEIPSPGHSFGDFSVTQSATCTSDGERARVCSVCGYSELEILPATGHIYGEPKVTKAATCTKAGQETLTCTLCGETLSQSLPATGHSFGPYSETRPATCTSKGVKTRVCRNCGKSETSSIPATGHSYGSWETSVPATCTSSGTNIRTCKTCGNIERKTVKATGHKYGGWVTTRAPSLQPDPEHEPFSTVILGERQKTCSRCGLSQTESLDFTKEEKLELARVVAQEIVDSVTVWESDLDRVSQVAAIVAGYSQSCYYTNEDKDYSTAFGVFVKGVYTCAGSTRALGLCLELMGFDWVHANENLNDHQWCKLIMDGKEGFADGQVGMVGYGKHPVDDDWE